MPAKQPEVKIRKSKNPITGIINVAGEPDTGKTWFAFSSGAQPERTAFIDDDVKGKAIADQLKAEGHPLGFYKNLVKEGKEMKELQFHKLCIDILDEVSQGDFDVLIWDTWTRFENTFFPMVVSNPSKYRQFYSQMGAIKGAEQWGAAFAYEAEVLDLLTEIAPLVILTSHLKKDAAKRDVAESKKPLIQKPRMRVYLRHSPNSPIPTGLMLKRLSKAGLGSDGMKPINVTHRKVFPFTWENLIHYWNNPVGNTPPSPSEQLNEFELSILDGILTKDQKDVLALSVIEAQREREEEERNTRMQKRILRNNGAPENSFKLIAKAMSEYGMDLEKLGEILGLEEDEIIALKGKEVDDAWEKIKTS
jgi:hypothetical protein